MVATIVTLGALVLTGVFSWVLFAGLRGSAWDASTSEQGLVLRHSQRSPCLV